MKIGEVASKTSASQMFATDAPSWGASFNKGRGVAVLSLFIQFKCIFLFTLQMVRFSFFSFETLFSRSS
ncbi:hypothetical protein ACJBSX_10965, partial [Streptococcus suis]